MPILDVKICFILCMVVLSVIGFYCSHRLSPENPFWVRLVVLSPSLTALGTLAAVAVGSYVAFWPDVARSFSVVLLYALVASRFTENPWLDIRTRD